MPYMKKLMNDPVGIGIPIRTFREEHDLSQDEMGALCGLTGSAISRIESGQRTRLEIHTLRMLAEAMGVTLDELVASASEAHQAATA